MKGSGTAFTPDHNMLTALTGRGSPNDVAPTYAATISLNPADGLRQKIATTSAVGNATVNAVNGGVPGQMLIIEVANDSGGARTVTFGTNFRPTGTVVGTASKSIVVAFISDGTNFIEFARSASAVT